MARVTKDGDGNPTIEVTVDEVHAGIFKRAARAAIRAAGDDEDELFDVDQFKGYRESDEVADVARRVVTEHRAHFARLRDLEIRYAVLVGKKPKPDSELDTLAKFVKVPGLYRDLFAADAVVWVNEELWKALDERQRSACVAHELCHGDVDESGKLTVRKHDVSEFTWVVRRYGAWLPDLRQFAEQLALFSGDGAKEAAS
jgi:predicted metallopeptidase